MAPLRKEKAINKAHKLLSEDTKIIDYCLLIPTVEGAWIDQKVQELLGLLKKQLRSATDYENTKKNGITLSLSKLEWGGALAPLKL